MIFQSNERIYGNILEMYYTLTVYCLIVAIFLIFIAKSQKCYQKSISLFGKENTEKLFKLFKIGGYLLILVTITRFIAIIL